MRRGGALPKAAEMSNGMNLRDGVNQAGDAPLDSVDLSALEQHGDRTRDDGVRSRLRAPDLARGYEPIRQGNILSRISKRAGIRARIWASSGVPLTAW